MTGTSTGTPSSTGTPAVGVARLVGVGVGPGDPDLLTLRAVRAIQDAEIIFAPTRRSGERSLALQIVHHVLDLSRQRVVTVPFPDERQGQTWDEAAETVLDYLGEHGHGAFLTEGDPLLFGSYGHLAAALRRRQPAILVETVPGVSSVTAAAAAAGIPLVDGQGRLAVVPGTAPLDQIEQTLRAFDCTVLLKVGPVMSRLLSLLDRAELLDSSVYVRRCGQPEQEIVTDLRALVKQPPTDYFALLIVHRR